MSRVFNTNVLRKSRPTAELYSNFFLLLLFLILVTDRDADSSPADDIATRVTRDMFYSLEATPDPRVDGAVTQMPN